MTDKLRIKAIGNFTTTVSNTKAVQVMPVDWQLDRQYDREPWGPPTEIWPADDGSLGGWTIAELHDIAHGVPCTCPIGELV